ncbi:hypothetical protein BJ944DRAFT_243779 [Cunninghamella echinulata]|nr:hypothetical protein BJ944DRAFT_243779 [Cunninghamella echinulata]
MEFYPNTAIFDQANVYQLPYIHHPMDILFEKKVNYFTPTSNNNNGNNNNNNNNNNNSNNNNSQTTPTSVKRKFEQQQEDDLFSYPYTSDPILLQDFNQVIEIRNENNNNKRKKQKKSVDHHQTSSIPSPTNTTITTTTTTTTNLAPSSSSSEQQKDIIKLEDTLHYLQDEWATIDIVLNSLKSAFTVYPSKMTTDEYLDEIDRELSIAYDDLMAQVRSLDRNLKRLDIKIKSCHSTPPSSLPLSLPLPSTPIISTTTATTTSNTPLASVSFSDMHFSPFS